MFRQPVTKEVLRELLRSSSLEQCWTARNMQVQHSTDAPCSANAQMPTLLRTLSGTFSSKSSFMLKS